MICGCSNDPNPSNIFTVGIGTSDGKIKLFGLQPLSGQTYFSKVFEQVMSNTFCLIPALSDLREPQWGSLTKEVFSLNDCIFVLRQTSESKNCGGLQLFRNISSITEKSDFCQKDIGKLNMTELPNNIDRIK